MKVIIAGSRIITNYKKIESEITLYINKLEKEFKQKVTEIVSGTAKGADKIGEQYAQKHNIDLKMFPAEWGKYPDAGKRRNVQMANYADAAILIWDGISRGTQHMKTIMMIKGKPFYIIFITDIDGRKL